MTVDVKERRWTELAREYGPLLLLIFILTWLVGNIVVFAGGYDVLVSDGIAYAYESQNLDRPFGIASNGDHVPGYPMAIWLLQTISFGVLSTRLVMQIIGFATLIGTTILLVYAFREYRYRWFWVLLFFVWPLVGILRVTILTADAPIYFLLIAALLLYRANKRWLFVAVVAAAFLVHKVSWFFLGPVLLIGLWQRRLTWYHCLAAGLPILLLGALGWSYYETPLWLLANNVEHDNFSGLGMVLLWQQTLAAPTPQLLAKSVLSAGLVLVSIFLAWQTWRRDRNAAEIWFALVPAVLCFAMSWWAIFVAVRYSSMLVFPLADYVEKRPWRLPLWLRAGALFASWALSLGFVYYAWFFFFD